MSFKLFVVELGDYSEEWGQVDILGEIGCLSDDLSLSREMETDSIL
jgi:hypothetical protein